MRRLIQWTMFSVLMLGLVVPASAAHWGYDGQYDLESELYTPEDWGHVSPLCDGTKQSPIDIETSATVRGDADIDFDYLGNTVDYSNNGHAVTAVPGRHIAVDGEVYTLAQFHFHTLSEHTVDGRHYDMEMHLVHADDAWLAGDTANGKLAVLGVFIKEGEKNEALAEVFEDLPHASHNGHTEVLTAKVVSNYKELLPGGNRVYSYSGSLTTPTCNEVVSWFVFEKPIEMSAEQIEAYRALFHNEDGSRYDTNRPVQPLNGRSVAYGSIKRSAGED